MPDTNSDRPVRSIPSHLGGAPRSFWGWVYALILWLITNVLYGFAIILAVVALWLETTSPITRDVVTAIMKSVSLPLLAWATALMLSSANIPRLFEYLPSLRGFKGLLLVATIFVLIISVAFIFKDPPDLSVYMDNPAANEKLFLGAKLISFFCLLIGACWFVVHTKSMDLEMKLRDGGAHEDLDKHLKDLARKSRTSTTAGDLKI